MEYISLISAALLLMKRTRSRSTLSRKDNIIVRDLPTVPISTTFRKAKTTDMEAVHGLIRKLAKYENCLDKVQVTLNDLISHHSSLKFDVIIAEICENSASKSAKTAAETTAQTPAKTSAPKIIGFAFFYFGFNTFVGRTVFLDDLFVVEKYRCHGIGAALMSRVAEYALKNGAKRMEWLSFRWNQLANTFYKNKIQACSNDHLMYWRFTELERLAGRR